MKNCWECKTKLGDLFQTGAGGTPLTTKREYYDGGSIPWLMSGEVGQGIIRATKTFITKLGLDNSSSRVFPRNTVLVALYGATAGQVGILKIEAATNQAVFGILPNDNFAPKFIFYLMLSRYKDLVSQAVGNAQPNLSGVKVKNTLIPLVPKEEQQRIVGILDEAFAGITTAVANAEKNRKNARALFESHLNDILSSKKWSWKKLGDLCSGVEYGSSAKSKSAGDIPILRMGNIQDRKLNWEKLAYSDNKAEIKKYLLKHNDVLFNRTNSPELVGKTAIYKSEMPAIFAGYLIRICRNEDLLDADYLNYFLNSQIALDYGKTVVISSVNQANINGTKLKGYPIPAPSLSEQQIIVEKLNALAAETQRLEAIYQQKLTALEELKKSLLHQAFSGEL